MARMFYRKLLDKAGNLYCVTIPHDVDPENMTEIISGMHDNIVKLKGYRLAGEGYRLPDNTEYPAGNKEFTFFKKVDVFNEFRDITQEDFSEGIKVLFEHARGFKINKPHISTFEGKPVKEDRIGYYLEREVECVAEGCTNLITPTRRQEVNQVPIITTITDNKKDFALKRILDMSKEDSNSDYFKGYTRGILEMLIGDEEKHDGELLSGGSGTDIEG